MRWNAVPTEVLLQIALVLVVGNDGLVTEAASARGNALGANPVEPVDLNARHEGEHANCVGKPL